jgi:hypothetical protein
MLLLEVLLTQHSSGDQIGKNEIVGAWNTCGERKADTGFWWGNLRERTTWKTQT